ncbi:MAG: 5'-methylthioadenosine/adenosylhomocysteine nucleosidase [Erysipelotrichaceae bacterium]|nr:5'-methylthioadenosine/adenosylhomocysteine nucleosidase [Erysipelotrichaceae bacterium]MDY5252488.1 5'-methylthioadenosine/adenosylhomocysteine nucleosidase [Erysipelotrichaceae bacterium]
MIAIIGAMEEEVKAILELTTECKQKIIHGIDFYEAKLAQRDVVIMRSGVAKCAATLSTTILFEHYDIEGVINIGTAGGLDDTMQVLDVVVSTHVCNYDLDVPGWDKDIHNPKVSFKANEAYVKKALEIIGEDEHVHVGLVATGDTFVHEPWQIKRIKDAYPAALCAEMEGSAIGQVCQHYQKPFVIIRSLSDVCTQGNSVISFEEYLAKASVRSAMWTQQFVASI